MNNIMSYTELFASSIDEIDHEEISIDDLTDTMLNEIINKVVTKVEDLSREIYGESEFHYMYKRLKHEFELEISDLIYETIELKNTIRRLKVEKHFP